VARRGIGGVNEREGAKEVSGWTPVKRRNERENSGGRRKKKIEKDHLHQRENTSRRRKGKKEKNIKKRPSRGASACWEYKRLPAPCGEARSGMFKGGRRGGNCLGGSW